MIRLTAKLGIVAAFVLLCGGNVVAAPIPAPSPMDSYGGSSGGYSHYNQQNWDTNPPPSLRVRTSQTPSEGQDSHGLDHYSFASQSGFHSARLNHGHRQYEYADAAHLGSMTSRAVPHSQLRRNHQGSSSASTRHAHNHYDRNTAYRVREENIPLEQDEEDEEEEEEEDGEDYSFSQSYHGLQENFYIRKERPSNREVPPPTAFDNNLQSQEAEEDFLQQYQALQGSFQGMNLSNHRPASFRGDYQDIVSDPGMLGMEHGGSSSSSSSHRQYPHDSQSGHSSSSGIGSSYIDPLENEDDELNVTHVQLPSNWKKIWLALNTDRKKKVVYRIFQRSGMGYSDIISACKYTLTKNLYRDLTLGDHRTFLKAYKKLFDLSQTPILEAPPWTQDLSYEQSRKVVMDMAAIFDISRDEARSKMRQFTMEAIHAILHPENIALPLPTGGGRSGRRQQSRRDRG
ncbi:hypothetical protein CBS101457_000306 [Exobasidium rhododendri]|nr:hypothetical protein CBS101457_000306 [Exobasidium rhododendri]